MKSSSTPINSALMKLTKRADQVDRDRLAETFVDTGPLLSLLTNIDHQVVYGRRGTGKTHALNYLSKSCVAEGDLPVFVDLRVIGSTGGVYADASLDVGERATKLLQDTLCFIHERLFEQAVEADEVLNLGMLGPHLDSFADTITRVCVEGETTIEQQGESKITGGSSSAIEFQFVPTPSATARYSSTTSSSRTDAFRESTTGDRTPKVNFAGVQSCLAKICGVLQGRRIWILLDEWSDIPIDLQPVLAHMIRKCLLCTSGVTVKIAAIEQRSQFRIMHADAANYIGIEIGADVTADLNFDDFMVFDNDAGRATSFFSQLLYRHVDATAVEHKMDVSLTSADDFVSQAFTQRHAFEELVRSAEGVPRDAINIIVLAAINAGEKAISVQHIRSAAKTWYQRDKEVSFSANYRLRSLLHWIIQEVIAHRKTRAFLLPSSSQDELIRALFDARVLHVLKRGISSNDTPGVRYDVYKIDYGCYVDLLTTVNAPRGLLPHEDPACDAEAQYIEVPPDDYRAIRRAILDLNQWREEVVGGDL